MAPASAGAAFLGVNMPHDGTSSTWGGHRPGSGRPKKEPMKSITIRIPERLYDLLRLEGQKVGKTVSSVAAERLVQQFITTHSSE